MRLLCAAAVPPRTAVCCASREATRPACDVRAAVAPTVVLCCAPCPFRSQAARERLAPGGEVWVTLAEGQGGTELVTAASEEHGAVGEADAAGGGRGTTGKPKAPRKQGRVRHALVAPDRRSSSTTTYMHAHARAATVPGVRATCL